MKLDQPRQKHSSPHGQILKFLWDLCCAVSVVGIWPRFVEPNLVFTKRLELPISGLPAPLEGLKIAQFSDLHLHPGVSQGFLDKIYARIAAFKPSLILFTGDFLCYARMVEESRLKAFLKRFQAPLGCFCAYGNHDYQSYVAVNKEGFYDIVDKVPFELWKGLKRIVKRQTVSGVMSSRLTQLCPHKQLVELLRDTPFVALENKTVQVKVGDSALNICGVGEYMANRLNVEQAFESYDKRFPGVILAHNPDCVPYLKSYPGDLILCGHVHGGQVNLPWLRDRFIVLENPEYVKGTYRVGNKWLHVNRGVGSTLQFRLFSPPEVTLITLQGVRDA